MIPPNYGRPQPPEAPTHAPADWGEINTLHQLFTLALDIMTFEQLCELRCRHESQRQRWWWN
jgi:hypothetical protein